MNYKRKKTRTKVRCAMCTPFRLGNKLADQRRIEKQSREDFRLQQRDL